MMRPQEYEVESVRYVTLTRIPEILLQRMQARVQKLEGRAHRGPYTNGGNAIDMDTSIALEVASVNEEVDNEEPKLPDLAVTTCQLRLNEFLCSLDILTQVSQYIEVLTPVLQFGGIELMHFLLTSEFPTLVSFALQCLVSLLVHPKFASQFLARDGLLLLIARPCAQILDTPEYNKTLALVLDNMFSVANSVEQICLMTEQAQVQLLELLFWLLSTAQEESIRTILIALSRILVYETFADLFHRHRHLEKLLDLWKYLQAIVDGVISPGESDVTMELEALAHLTGSSTHGIVHAGGNQDTNNEQTSSSSSTANASSSSMNIASNDANGTQNHSGSQNTRERGNDDEEETNLDEPDIPKFPHLKLLPPLARSLIDHLFLVLAEYFSATCVQTYMSSARHSSGTTLSVAPTPKYRATNANYEFMASLELVHQSLVALPDSGMFVRSGGLELLFRTIHATIDHAHSQTGTDIITAGLKMIWIFTSLKSTSELVLNLRVRLAEKQKVSFPLDIHRHIAARVSDLLRPTNPGMADITLRGVPRGWMLDGAVERADIAEEGEEEENADDQANNAANANEGGANNANGQNGNYMDRLDLTNIRLEPVNQRVALERAAARSRSGSVTASDAPAAETSANQSENASTNQTENNQAEGSAMEVENGGGVAQNPSAEVDASQTNPTESNSSVKIKRRPSMWILLHWMRRLATTCPAVPVYILQTINNYLHVASCYTCTAQNRSQQSAKTAVAELRHYNGLSELVGLLKFHEISSSGQSGQPSVNIASLTDWNFVRAHVMTVLSRISQVDGAVQQILSKKLQSTLPEILRATVPPGLEKSFSQFKDKAYAFLGSTNAGISVKKDDNFANAAATLSKLERTSIIANTPITYSKQELLQLIYQHFQANGLSRAAEALAKDAEFTPEMMRPPAPPTIPKPRIRRGSMLGSASASSTWTNAQTPAKINHPDAPTSQNGFLPEGPNSQISLETIVKQYLYEQHKHCRHPVQVLPDLSLHSRHSCPEPIPHRMNPYGLSSTNIAHRLMAHSLTHAPMRSEPWRLYKYSRHAARRRYADAGVLTSITWIDHQNILFGSGDGLVIRYNAATVNYDDEWEVRDGPVEIRVSTASNRVLSMCDSASSMLAAPEDMKIWDLNNMSHELGELPFVTANFSNSGLEVLGTRANSTISLWDVASSTVVRTFRESALTNEDDHRNHSSILPGNFSPDDRLVLHNSTLWDVRRSNPIHNFDRFAFTSGSQLFSPSGLEVITNTEVWDARTFKLYKTVPSLQRAQLTFTHSGDALYCANRSKVEVLDGATYDYISSLTLDTQFASLSINPDDTQLAILETAASDRWVGDSQWRVWDIGAAKPLVEDDLSDSDSGDDSSLGGFDSERGDMDEDSDDDSDGGGGHRHVGDGMGLDIDDDDDEDDEDDDSGDFGASLLGSEGDFGEEEEEEEEDFYDEDEDDHGHWEFDSQGEPAVYIDDYDPEGDGASATGSNQDDAEFGALETASAGSLMELDTGELDEETLKAMIEAGAFDESGDEGESADFGFGEDSESSDLPLPRSGRAPTGRRGAKRSSSRGGTSSVFMELPSDEEKATRMLETGDVDSSAMAEDDDESDASVMEFGDDGENIPSSDEISAVVEEPSIDESEEASAEEIIVRPRSSNQRSRGGSSATRAKRTTPTRGRAAGPRLSMRDLSQMLGFAKRAAKASGKATASTTASSAPPHQSDEENDESRAPPKKKAKKKE